MGNGPVTEGSLVRKQVIVIEANKTPRSQKTASGCLRPGEFRLRRPAELFAGPDKILRHLYHLP